MMLTMRMMMRMMMMMMTTMKTMRRVCVGSMRHPVYL
jgi:hypothetical protein